MIRSSGREISATEALTRLQAGKPVLVQRMRSITLTPDMKKVEALVLKESIDFVDAFEENTSNQPQTENYTRGWQRRFGLPETLNSFAELKLLSCIYNEDVPIPPPSPKDNATVVEQNQIMERLKSLMTRTMESGIHFYTHEDRFFRRFLYRLSRTLMFWTPVLCVGIVWTTGSEYAMGHFGAETISMFPSATEIAPDISEVDTAEEVASAFENLILNFIRAMGSVPASIAASVGISIVQSAQQARSTSLGFQLCSYSALKRLSCGRPIVLQEKELNSINVPLFASVTWFNYYRPGDFCSSLKDLDSFCKIFWSKLKTEK